MVQRNRPHGILIFVGGLRSKIRSGSRCWKTLKVPNREGRVCDKTRKATLNPSEIKSDFVDHFFVHGGKELDDRNVASVRTGELRRLDRWEGILSVRIVLRTFNFECECEDEAEWQSGKSLAIRFSVQSERYIAQPARVMVNFWYPAKKGMVNWV